jgi:hypothetical protein
LSPCLEILYFCDESSALESFRIGRLPRPGNWAVQPHKFPRSEQFS